MLTFVDMYGRGVLNTRVQDGAARSLPCVLMFFCPSETVQTAVCPIDSTGGAEQFELRQVDINSYTYRFCNPQSFQDCMKRWTAMYGYSIVP